MSRNQEFYHGSNHDLSEGELLTPARARNSHVYYTDSHEVASRYGSKVYSVTPLTAEKDRKRPYGANANEYLTKSGARVNRKIK